MSGRTPVSPEDRRRRRLAAADLTPEQRAAADARRADRQTPRVPGGTRPRHRRLSTGIPAGRRSGVDRGPGRPAARARTPGIEPHGHGRADGDRPRHHQQARDRQARQPDDRYAQDLRQGPGTEADLEPRICRGRQAVTMPQRRFPPSHSPGGAESGIGTDSIREPRRPTGPNRRHHPARADRASAVPPVRSRGHAGRDRPIGVGSILRFLRPSGHPHPAGCGPRVRRRASRAAVGAGGRTRARKGHGRRLRAYRRRRRVGRILAVWSRPGPGRSRSGGRPDPETGGRDHRSQPAAGPSPGARGLASGVGQGDTRGPSEGWSPSLIDGSSGAPGAGVLASATVPGL